MVSPSLMDLHINLREDVVCKNPVTSPIKSLDRDQVLSVPLVDQSFSSLCKTSDPESLTNARPLEQRCAQCL